MADKDKISIKAKEYYQDNKDQIKRKVQEWTNNHKEHHKKYHKEYYTKHKDKIKEYLLKNKEKIAIRKKEYDKKNKDHISIRGKKYYQNNKDKIKESKREYNNRGYYLKNKDKIIKVINIYVKKKRKTNINFKILTNLRRRMNHALKDNSKSKRTRELIGCSVQELKQHLEKQFTLGMNWKNYGFGWHVDHARPCSSFDLTKEEEQKKCFNYSNMQPMWAIENIKKGGIIK